MLLAINVPPPARSVPLNGSFFSRGPIPGTPISITGSLHHNVCSASCEGNVGHCFLCERINTVSGGADVIRPAAKNTFWICLFIYFFEASNLLEALKVRPGFWGFLPGSPWKQSFFDARRGEPIEMLVKAPPDLRSDSGLEVFGVFTQTRGFAIPH